MKRAFKQSFSRWMVIVSVAVFVLGVLPGAAQAITLWELVDPAGPKPTIVVDKLIFSDFTLTQNVAFPPKAMIGEADLTQITVEPIGTGTPYPGLKFTPNPEPVSGAPPWSIDTDFLSAFQLTRFSYKVAHLDGSPLIKENSISLFPGSVTSGSFASVSVEEEIRDQTDASIGIKEVFHQLSQQPFDDFFKVDQNLSDKAEFSPLQTSVSAFVTVIVEASPDTLEVNGRTSVSAFEQRFSLGPSMADAAPDNVVFDEVTLDGGRSIDGSYLWELKHKQNPGFDREAVGVNPVVTNLKPGLYDVTLTVTDDSGNVTHLATMLLAAAGAAGEVKSSEGSAAGMHLWRFKIKKYKYYNWAFARVFATIDAASLPLEDVEDKADLDAKVTLEVSNDGKVLGVWSTETKAEVRDRKYKYVIRKH